MSSGSRIAAGAGALAALATMLFSSTAIATPRSIRERAAQEVWLATVTYRIAAANSLACRAPEFMSGLVLHDLTQYDPAVRTLVSRVFSMSSGFGVLRIVPGSVAAEAGIRVDDEIVAVGQFSIRDAGAEPRSKSRNRLERFDAVLQEAFASGSTALLVRRRGSLLTIPMRAQQGCGGKLVLSDSSTLNAFADGRHVVVTNGMSRLARNTEEIAFVIAHEMAHNILGHSSEADKRGFFGFLQIRREEIEADRYAVRLLANAGYNPAGGIAFLRHARKRLWWNVSLDHPGFTKRIRVVRDAMLAPAG